MKELNEIELKKIDGGVIWFVALFVAAAIAGVITDWPGFKKGIVEGLKDS